MKKGAVIFVSVMLMMLLSTVSYSQNVRVTSQNKKAVMQFIMQGGDTLFVDELAPAIITARSNIPETGREWVLYYKRVYNFAKAYPYSLFIAQTINETDSLFAAHNFTKIEKERYLNRMKDALLANFKPIFSNLTLGQGLMMIRLIDRNVGKTPYVIINEYLGGINATFWQGFAKLLKGDLKQGYDSIYEDADLEELVDYWDRGMFDYLYRMIFGEPAPDIYIPQQFEEPFYKSLENDKYFKKILEDRTKG